MTLSNALPTERFLHSLGIVHKEGRHLLFSHDRLASQAIHEALNAVPMLMDTYNRIRSDALTRLGLPEDRLPPPLPGVSGQT